MATNQAAPAPQGNVAPPAVVIGVTRDDMRTDRQEGGVGYEREAQTDDQPQRAQGHALTADQRKAILDTVKNFEPVRPDKQNFDTVDGSPILESMYALALRRVKERFRGSLTFPIALVGMADLTYYDVLLYSAKKSDGSVFSAPEAAMRAALFSAGEITDADCLGTQDPLIDEELMEMAGEQHVGDPEEACMYMAGLGTALIMMSVAKPFVDRVTVASEQMCRNMRADLQLAEDHLTPQVFGTMFNTYVRHADLRKIARTMADRKFPGWAWGTAYAARYGAGTSHLSLICSFYSKYPDCPVWKVIPGHELDALVEAINLIETDALALYPIAGGADLSLDRLRVTAMPCLVHMCLTGFAAAGEKNWARYQNVPQVSFYGSRPAHRVSAILLDWMNVKVNGGTWEENWADIVEAAKEIPKLPRDLVAMFSQSDGKVKSSTQRAGRR